MPDFNGADPWSKIATLHSKLDRVDKKISSDNSELGLLTVLFGCVSILVILLFVLCGVYLTDAIDIVKDIKTDFNSNTTQP